MFTIEVAENDKTRDETKTARNRQISKTKTQEVDCKKDEKVSKDAKFLNSNWSTREIATKISTITDETFKIGESKSDAIVIKILSSETLEDVAISVWLTLNKENTWVTKVKLTLKTWITDWKSYNY